MTDTTAELAHAAEDVRKYLALRVRAVQAGALDNPDVIAAVWHDQEGHALTDTVLRTLLAERDALAERNAELEVEREQDLRVVAAVVRAREGHEEGRALNSLAARFHGRIAALDAAARVAATEVAPPSAWWQTRGACRYCGCDVLEDRPFEPVGDDGVAHAKCHARAAARTEVP